MFSEKEIQQQIWQQRGNWIDIIDSAEIPEPYSFLEDISDLSPERLIQNNLYKQLSLIDEALRATELIGCEVPLIKQGDSTIRADFLGVSGNPGFVILELKKSNQTERESFTELLAYSNHITTAFPAMCKEDIYYILIAPMDGRIVREALIQSLVFDRKLIYALIPYFTNPNSIESLRLKPWIPDIEMLSTLTRAVFERKNFSVVKIVWEHSSEWAIEDAFATLNVTSKFNRISAFAAQIMEHRGIHGFVFSSQLWTELVEVMPFSNSLIIVALNPYAIANNFFEPYTDFGFDITKVLPGLKKSIETLSEEDNHHFNLYSCWDSHLFKIGFQVLEQALQNTNGEKVLLDWGSMSWVDYQHQFLEYIACQNFDIRPTGILRELYWDVTNIDYRFIAENGLSEHPIHGDIYRYAVDTLNSHNLFSTFIARMLEK